MAGLKNESRRCLNQTWVRVGVYALLLSSGFAVIGSATDAQADSSCYAAPGPSFTPNNYFSLAAYDSYSCVQPASSSTTTSVTTAGHRWDTTAFVGVSLPIGEAFNPHFDFGVRETDVNTAGFVYGAEANASISLLKGLKDTQFRLLGLVGSTMLQGNAGVGWDADSRALLLNAGLQVPYVRGFLDYRVDNRTLRASLELNSLSAIRAAAQMQEVTQAPTCSAGKLDDKDQAFTDLLANLNGTATNGDIFVGSFVWSAGLTAIAGGTPSTAWVNNQTCFSTSPPVIDH